MRKLALIFLFLPVLVFAEDVRAEFSTASPPQGGTVVVKFLYPNLVLQSAEFDGTKVPTLVYNGMPTAVFGIPATKRAGGYTFRAKFTNGEELTKTIHVWAKRFTVVNLPVPEKLDMTPKELTVSLSTQNNQIRDAVSKWLPTAYFKSGFGLPLYDNRRLGSLFGEIRRTGKEEIRHLGVDFTARKGAMVAAINTGVVQNAYRDPIYGNTVILDHGGGIYSLYMHLNEIKAKTGDFLPKGKVLGTVGDSGYSTGPHLHLSVKVGSVSVDPLTFVRVFK